jgi:hypothetical protein
MAGFQVKLGQGRASRKWLESEALP